MKYEYEVVHADGHQLNKVLNYYGKKGWHVVGSYHYGSWTIILERPKQGLDLVLCETEFHGEGVA
jgi:hypothetical protein